MFFFPNSKHEKKFKHNTLTTLLGRFLLLFYPTNFNFSFLEKNASIISLQTYELTKQHNFVKKQLQQR